MASSAHPPENERFRDPSTKPFRFKRKRAHTPTPTEIDPETYKDGHQQHHSHHHHRSRRRTRPSTSPCSAYPPNSAWGHQPDSETAFRESLFDALADDEGAAFWEGVYGQPIHTYSPYFPAPSDNVGDITGDPKLERMTDEEYVSYVRARMWEKSHAHVLEERQRREEERARRKEKEAQERRFQVDVEDALRRGQERRKRGRWKQAWEAYVEAWDESGAHKAMERDKIRWPVESGRWKDVNKDEVERFFRCGPAGAGDFQASLAAILKRERVNWHPDRWQQRAGPAGMDEKTMKLVTAVFQVVDRMWSQSKE